MTTDLDTFRALEADLDAVMVRAQACLRRYAPGLDAATVAAIDAEYDALFWEGEAIAERLVALEAARATAGRRAA